MASLTRSIEMSVPKKALYQAITDFESYPVFLPEVVSAKIKDSQDKVVVVEFELELVKRFQYSLEFTLSPENVVRWELKDSNFFKKNEGAWHLNEQGVANTAVKYELDVDFGFFVPKFISKKLTEVTLPKMFEQFEERARALL